MAASHHSGYSGEKGYLGHTVNFKTTRKSYKSKKKVNNDPSEWVIFENTHEAIIDQETFEIVQNIRNGRRRLTPMGEMPILSGMLFCADCGAKLYQVRARGWTHEQEQKDLEARVTTLREIISKAKRQRLNIDSFLAQVKKYTEIKELDAEIIRTLVERIDVFTPEKVPCSRTKKQTVLIHWNFLGAVDLPQEQKKSA